MDNCDKDKDFERVLDEAALWVSRLQGTETSAAQKRAFTRWLNVDQRHQQAYQEMLDTWEQTGLASDIPELKAEAEYLSKIRPTSNKSFYKTVLLSTVASIMVFVGAFSFQFLNPPVRNSAIALNENFNTEVGEIREVLLPDGSKALLNTRTRIGISFDDQNRNVELISGEAFFDVAHDSQRPFIVKIGSNSVKAVGTAFNIYKKRKETIVTITEGIVKIKGQRQDQGIEVDAMHKVSIDAKSVVSVLSADPETELAWQNKQIVFRDEPLTDVLRELNRFLTKPVSISSSSIPSKTVSGTFDIRKPEQALQVLIDSFGLKEKTEGRKRILFG